MGPTFALLGHRHSWCRATALNVSMVLANIIFRMGSLSHFLIYPLFGLNSHEYRSFCLDAILDLRIDTSSQSCYQLLISYKFFMFLHPHNISTEKGTSTHTHTLIHATNPWLNPSVRMGAFPSFTSKSLDRCTSKVFPIAKGRKLSSIFIYLTNTEESAKLRKFRHSFSQESSEILIDCDKLTHTYQAWQRSRLFPQYQSVFTYYVFTTVFTHSKNTYDVTRKTNP